MAAIGRCRCRGLDAVKPWTSIAYTLKNSRDLRRFCCESCRRNHPRATLEHDSCGGMGQVRGSRSAEVGAEQFLDIGEAYPC
jgi:hypothetical protein